MGKALKRQKEKQHGEPRGAFAAPIILEQGDCLTPRDSCSNTSFSSFFVTFWCFGVSTFCWGCEAVWKRAKQRLLFLQTVNNAQSIVDLCNQYWHPIVLWLSVVFVRICNVFVYLSNFICVIESGTLQLSELSLWQSDTEEEVSRRTHSCQP